MEALVIVLAIKKSRVVMIAPNRIKANVVRFEY